MAIETWGNNDWHDPEICEHCSFDSCPTCSNGPRLKEYRRAEAELYLKEAKMRELNGC